jgi:dTDP-4-dehydrorhamnose 3,5-epimerase
VVREVLNVPGDRGVLTEIFRQEWDPDGAPVAQVFQVRLFPGSISAWHCHLKATDRLFVSVGHAKIVLYDARDGFPTRGRINEFHVGESRPTLIVVPPSVWHGVQNVGGAPACIVNAPTLAYDYQDPDHYRVPSDSAEIPYSWTRRGNDSPPEP